MYQVIRRIRKNISIKIDDDLKVVLIVPHGISDAIIQETYLKHQEWIQKTIEVKKDKQSKSNWITNREIYYFGELKKVIFIKSKAGDKGVKLIKDNIYIFTPDIENTEMVRKQIENYYKQVGRDYLVQQTNYYCNLLGCEYKRISLKKQKTRWGSCSSQGNLNYNVRIICAPKEMIDYIVLHEVMHLIHFNHSHSFWKAIEEIMPDYKVRQGYFNKNGDRLYV